MENCKLKDNSVDKMCVSAETKPLGLIACDEALERAAYRSLLSPIVSFGINIIPGNVYCDWRCLRIYVHR